MSPARVVDVAHDQRRVLSCDRCPRTWSSETSLAAHLMDVHDLSTADAVELAQRIAEASKAARKGESMPSTSENAKQLRHCGTCGRIGHRVDACPRARRTTAQRKTAKAPAAARNAAQGDREIRALGAVLDALRDLDPAARQRVVTYALTRFAIDLSARK